MFKVQKLLFLIPIFLFFYSCKKEEKRYYWNPAISAPDHYPAAYVGISLDYEIGGGAGAASVFRPISPGWGRPYGAFVVGNRLKPIPVSVSANWMSVPEAVYYKGTFDLPKDSIQEIFERKEYDSIFRKYRSANEIMVGMAPGGIITVWINGLMKQIEVGRFQAIKTDQKPEGLVERGLTMEGLSKALLSDEDELFIKKFGVPLDAWKKKPKEYQYQIDILHPKHYPIATGGSWVNTIDGRAVVYVHAHGMYDEWQRTIGQKNKFPKKHSLPLAINTIWYSAAEEVIYESSNNPLPIKLLDSLFSKPYEYPETSGKMVRFNKLVVGMAPGGVFVVWIDGPGRQIEIARFKAEKSKESLRSFIDSRYDEELSEQAFKLKILDSIDRVHIKEQGIPYGSWQHR